MMHMMHLLHNFLKGKETDVHLITQNLGCYRNKFLSIYVIYIYFHKWFIIVQYIRE
jgi:uncharacterized protein (DUF39 family)